ncbi:MAG TPA: lactate utilization protein B, partial [Acidimicrobiales bacterium]|nr:lactate utilization protein B [Acidimicrobiales bacterium]
MTRTFEGSPPFPQAAVTALADQQLRVNLGRATTTIRNKRDRVVGELDTWEDLRLAGEAIKSSALGRLDELLATLEERVTAAGGVVHWARDADEANRIVVGLVQATGTDGVVKVKSMTTGETGLNVALEQAGIAAYETDLAELIVQLGDDLPSHIVVPAIHRSRSQIRQTFVEQMGAWGKPAPEDLTEEPVALAAAARQHLRERFLRAEVGISGANFLVADTGSVVIVESEGNGRMCLTLPRTLITVAGVDKVVGSWEDLDVLLQTLPRSATGERMNPYTSIWTGVTPGDGPEAFHLVLVDDGRTQALADPVGRQALRCIRCAACLNVCPVYERVGGHAYGSVYPGPIGAVLTPQLDHVAGDSVSASLPYASTLCGACFDACPVRIDIPRLLVHLRAEVVDSTRGALPRTQQQSAMAAAAWVLARPGRLVAAARAGAGAGRLLESRPVRRVAAALGIRSWRLRLPGWAAGWSDSRTVPLPTEPPFADWWRRTHGRHPGPAAAAGAGDTGDTRPAPQADTAGGSRAGTDPAGKGRTPPAPQTGGTRPAAQAGAPGGPGRLAGWTRRRRPTTPPAAGLRSERQPATTGPAREAILDRVRTALGRDRATITIPRDYRRPPGPRPADPVELFVQRVDDYTATVHRVAEPELAATVARLLAA